MTPQDLLKRLRDVSEDQGRALLSMQVPVFSDVAVDRLFHLIKKEADRCWIADASLSFKLSGYLLAISDLTRNKGYRALGLATRADALRRLDRYQEAVPFFDAAGEEYAELGDEVGWARSRVGRISACLRLNRTTEALEDAEAVREIFIRHGKLLRAGQADVNTAIIRFELGHYEKAARLFDRAIETYQLHGDRVDLHIARARGNKALTLAALGRFDKAIELHE